MTKARPNVLFLMTDQQRFDSLGCAGNYLISTPNLDTLAASGVRFSHAFTPTPVCVAARMSLITGHRARQTHWTDNDKLPGPAPELPTIMTIMSEAGYRTHAVGKLHFQGRHYGLHGIDSMEEVPDYRIDDDYLLYLREHGLTLRYPHGIRDLLYFQPQTVRLAEKHAPNTWVADRAIDFLKEHRTHRPKQPFFLWASWIAPHPPFAPCEPYDSLYDPRDMTLPYFAERPISSLPSPCWAHRGRLDGAHLDNERIRRLRALYYGQITHVNVSIGRVLQALNDLDLTDNTVVVFTSDHGDMLGDHGLSQKNVPYESSVRVPLLLRWPGRTEAGRECNHLVGLTDLLPTFMHGLELDYPRNHAPPLGDSLLSLDGGGMATKRDSYIIDYGHGSSRWISIRTKSHMFTLWAAGGYQELYDIREDSEQRHNLLAEQPEMARHLRSRVLFWERQYGMPSSFEDGTFRVYPEPEMPAEDFSTVVINQSKWPENLPDEERISVESYAKAFTSAIAKETTLAPEKLDLKSYKQKGGDLTDTPWEDAWKRLSLSK